MGATSGRIYSSRSCFLLPANNPVRRRFIDFIEWPWFDGTVLLLICLNCAFLAVQGPPESKNAPFNEATAAKLELFFQIMFTVEMVCKWFAMGIVAHKTAYARDGWNLLDMTVVFAGWIPIILEALGLPGLDNISAIRSVRALRPLRSVQRLPGLRRQVITMIDSLPKMADVALLGSFILLVYGKRMHTCTCAFTTRMRAHTTHILVHCAYACMHRRARRAAVQGLAALPLPPAQRVVHGGRRGGGRLRAAHRRGCGRRRAAWGVRRVLVVRVLRREPGQ